jgi:hypothetical protein
MQVKSDQLLNCRQCGQKINHEILTIQSEIKSFILHQINEKGFMNPEELLNAPCLAGIRVSDQKGDAGDISLYTDVNDPAPWLSKWVNKLSCSKNQAKAFKLRKGMLGLPSITLDAIGEQIGVTKERVRQIII